jgi:hypothetical protein
MDEGKGKFHIEPRVLILFLLLGIPTLVIGHLILVNGAESRFREVVGTYFGHQADRVQAELVTYLEDLSIQVANLTQVPQVQTVVREANSRKPTEAHFEDEIREIENQWPQTTERGERLRSEVLENTASNFLRQYNRVVATFQELLITDMYGRLVAASGQTSDFFQADEKWWRVAYLEGQGQRFISDVKYDDSARVYCVEIAEPIRDAGSGQVIGIVKAIVDSDALFGLLGDLRFGQNAVAVLLRSDGSIVTDPEVSEPYPFIQQVLTALTRQRNSVETPEEDPLVFLGIPQSEVGNRIPELDWHLVIQAPHDEVFRPFHNLRSRFLWIVGCSVGLLILADLYVGTFKAGCRDRSPPGTDLRGSCPTVAFASLVYAHNPPNLRQRVGQYQSRGASFRAIVDSQRIHIKLMTEAGQCCL